MGILGRPMEKGVLKTPRSQNQQYHYSNLIGKTQPLSQNFNPINPYFSSGFKQIGVNDPVFKSNQIFYDNSKDGFSGKQNQLRNALQNPVPFNYNSKSKMFSNNFDNENNANKTSKLFENIEGSKFRGSFCQQNNKLPDTPVFKNSGKRASNLRKILEKRDHEEMSSNKKKPKKANEMLDPRSQTGKKKSKKTYL